MKIKRILGYVLVALLVVSCFAFATAEEEAAVDVCEHVNRIHC